ncbi:arabinan endo-1,5-alpha-L-arabinosidase [Marinilabilia salmonicolor]|jgi:arabinan endo-1,5-alpha-L-arabinosidase|uniref:Arabinan endo-1,5-alpha-L-arabinosidase n=1 Tax=Marinilabilia salmonicolor TaxID=989 RepID=A0A2T0XSZ3_9BACT|nr:arabinan endo-1,5-alpha-L-arabinosidase [Marinilabilia salmonicolor]PRZ01982.1 arabinan endo-1,5-alpha-L-arabinosidase [Marinilabilia salmonicolor]RCW39416.1 arabinan endo-1,5-alpha-L-arabinosidase [Marinilabilia salmonicolor]
MRLKYLLFLSAILTTLLFAGCEDDEVDPRDDENGTETETEWSIPTYADDYSPIASWANRSEWNLANVHDPSVAYYDGYYYMYGTDASYGNEHEGHGHFQGKRSKDLVNWQWVGGPFYDPPSWVADSLNSIRSGMGLDAIPEEEIQYGYWAPVVRRVNVGGQEKLRMYYSIVIHNYIKTGNPTTSAFDGSWTERAFIGMCESTDPAGAVWEDKGFVTTSSSDLGLDYSRSSTNDWSAYFYYNAIDPTYIVSPEGKHYLIHGSWHSGFALLEVDATTGKPLNTLGAPYANSVSELTARYGQRIGTRTASSRWQASEAPEVIYKDGYYYLFMAYDGLDVPYNTRVVRSENIEGPYYDITGRNFTNGRGDSYPIVTHPYKFNLSPGWVGISHCAIFQHEDTDEWFYMSQGRLPKDVPGIPASNALMMGHVRKIVWCPASASEPDNLWPLALPQRYAAVPDYGTITRDSLIGKWEHIKLEYKYAQQNTASSLTLNADGTMSGALTGNWSYDEEKKQLTLGNVIVCVEREVDWEATPRRVTFVYAGTEKNLNATFWGKKSR